ncbi:MAG: CDP-2,3-bis-(O-geranylgeranyl)-sn-glycerol synthase [Candidatus Methanoplasma sp.]|jgi:CDP-2,3-bis-(O-geranylgeranyl)-sn-glycerol synthase|nr:CDP-2,3-bis-(O-geranylgeranyl)-sn-glycerol synthase [Candidatus Methanoplasma sp.]
MSFLDFMAIIASGFWLFLPAMAPNSAAALFGRKARTKMDFGRSWRGRRILGDGKSWLGMFGGAFSGVALGLILMCVSHPFDPSGHWGFGSWGGGLGVLLSLSFGAILGDVAGAFVKRRLGMERGQKAPVLDQYDFVAGALLLTLLFFPDWVLSAYYEGWHICALIAILAVMFFIHRAVNKIGFRMGVKKEPW